jgi:hypothetical protein
MAGIKHTFVSAVSQGTDANLIRRDDWNAEHTITPPVVFGDITFNNGSITCSGGTISFDNENLTTSGTMTCGECKMTGDLNHDGSKIGFFGGAPVVKSSVDDLGSVTVSAGDDTLSLSSLQTALDGIQTTMNALLDALQDYGLV